MYQKYRTLLLSVVYFGFFKQFFLIIEFVFISFQIGSPSYLKSVSSTPFCLVSWSIWRDGSKILKRQNKLRIFKFGAVSKAQNFVGRVLICSRKSVSRKKSVDYGGWGVAHFFVRNFYHIAQNIEAATRPFGSCLLYVMPGTSIWPGKIWTPSFDWVRSRKEKE